MNCDNAITVPGYISWCAPTDRLIYDCLGSGLHKLSFGEKSATVEAYDRYFHEYARYLCEACVADGDVYKVNDWKCMIKSGICQRVMEEELAHNDDQIRQTANQILVAVFPRSRYPQLLDEGYAKAVYGQGNESKDCGDSCYVLGHSARRGDGRSSVCVGRFELSVLMILYQQVITTGISTFNFSIRYSLYILNARWK
jgi:hypothetical protein